MVSRELRRKRRRRLILLVLMGAALLPCLLSTSCASFWMPPDTLHPEELPPRIQRAPSGPLEAGASVVDITPERSIYIAGYKICKPSEGVHDPITVRALALRRGDLISVIACADLIGLHNYMVEIVRDRLAERASRDAILIACTHNHAGPDTLGMWGIPPLITGLDDDYTEKVLAGITQAASEAIDRLGPVMVRWGETQAPAKGISRNIRIPDLIDRTVTALAFDRPGGAPVATLVHFACHPEALGSNNTQLSADFPSALYARVEEERPGSVTVYLNGALGGMITTDEEAPTFAEIARIGSHVGGLALEALATGEALPAELELVTVRRPINMPIENRRFHLADFFGIFGDRPFIEGGYTPSEVSAYRIGPVVLVTAPGEVLPRVGFELDGMIDGRPGLLVSLGGDEMGYLIHEEDWESDLYKYERTVSPGPLATGLIRTTIRLALEDVGALRSPGDD